MDILNNMPLKAQSGDVNFIQAMQNLGINFTVDKNGALQSMRSTIIDPDKLFSDPEMLKRFKGGWFVSDPTYTYWIYLKINKGRIIDIMPITTFFVLKILILNYVGGKFDLLSVVYSTNTAHTEPQTAIIHYNNYTPTRIMNDIKGLTYISDAGEKLKGSLIYFLISQKVKYHTPQEVQYTGPQQGWWLSPNKKFIFNPPHGLSNVISENLAPEIRGRENPIQSAKFSQNVTKELQPLLERKPAFQIAILFRMGSLYSTFFTHYGIISNQILVARPNTKVPVELNCALFKNVRYDNFTAPSLGTNIKHLKEDIKNINDAIILSIDPFAADQYSKIEKGLDYFISDINGAVEGDKTVNHIPVIISSFADLHIPKNMRCVLSYDDCIHPKYNAIQYRNTLRMLDAALIMRTENDFENFIKTFAQHLTELKTRVPSSIPNSKVYTYIRLITMSRTYNSLFGQLFPLSLEKRIEEWLCSQEQARQPIFDVICSEYGKILNQKISDGYYNLLLKEEVTPFDKGSHTIIVDEAQHRIYIETADSLSIAKNDMSSVSDTDSLTIALYSCGYLPHNPKKEKSIRIAAVSSDGVPYPLYVHAIKYTLLTQENRQCFELIDKAANLFAYDEIPSEGFLPLIKTVDGRYAGKILRYTAEESNIYFGTGRTGSGKSWAIAQIICMLFMLGHTVVVFDVSGSYTKQKLLRMLPDEVVEKLFKFINIGVGYGMDMVPVDLGSLKGCNSLPDKKRAIYSVLRAATGSLNNGIARKLKGFLSDYLKGKKYTIDFNDLCYKLARSEALGSEIADSIQSVFDDIKDIQFKNQSWDDLFLKNGKIIVINLGNEVGDSTHQLLDMMIGSLFNWQMTHDSAFLSIAIDELIDQDFSKGSPLSTIVKQGRKFHTALIGATQDYYNQGSSNLDTMKQANMKSFCRPGKSEDRVAQKLGYSNAVDAGFNKFRAGDTILEFDGYNKETDENEALTLKGRVVDFVETPLYEKFKEIYGDYN